MNKTMMAEAGSEVVGEIDGEVVGFEVVGAVNGEVVGPPRTRPSNPMDRTAEHDSAW